MYDYKLEYELYAAIKRKDDSNYYVFSLDHAKLIFKKLLTKSPDYFGHSLDSSVSISNYYKSPDDGIAFKPFKAYGLSHEIDVLNRKTINSLIN